MPLSTISNCILGVSEYCLKCTVLSSNSAVIQPGYTTGEQKGGAHDPSVVKRKSGARGGGAEGGKRTAAQLTISEGSGQGQSITESESSAPVFQGMRWINKHLD